MSNTEAPTLREALTALLEYCAERDPGQGDPERDDPRVTAAGAALAQPAASGEPAAPPGYILVPEELEDPTEEMLDAFQKAFVQQLHKRRHKPHLESAERAGIRAMLKASPTATAQPAQALVPLTHELIREARQDAVEVFDAEGSKTPQIVRDVIEYMASWLEVYADKAGTPAKEAPL